MRVDVVGGSISGLSTAISIKEHNPAIEVVVHEKYKTIGYNHEGRRCGEAHTVEHEWSKWKPEPKSIFDEIIQGNVSIGPHHLPVNRPLGDAYILNRQEFICQLARAAEKHHVHLSTGDHVKSVHDLDGAYIVDASGCPSSIKRELGFGTGPVGVAYQQTLQDANCFREDFIELIFMEDMGYYWVFPRDPAKREMNIGVGTFANIGKDLRGLLETFKARRHITGKVSYVIGGLVPIGLQYPLMHENILFVGDAGVGTFPMNGQGIYRALFSGDIAGRCIGTNQVRRYPHRIHKAFVKWNLIGGSFIQVNRMLRHINPALFLTSLHIVTKLGVQFHQLTL